MTELHPDEHFAWLWKIVFSKLPVFLSGRDQAKRVRCEGRVHASLA
jgi:hypothetical protein